MTCKLKIINCNMNNQLPLLTWNSYRNKMHKNYACIIVQTLIL